MTEPSLRPVLLEVCVDTPEGLAAAVAGGADRIELCSALALGGLSPAPGLVALAARAPVPVYAMIRPRAGDFVFSPAEREAMLAEVAAMRAAGLAGVVLGASRPDRTLDAELLAALRAEAGALGATLHRAFDLVPDMAEALETAVALGFERILTAGGARSAALSLDVLAALVAQGAGRLSVMPGAGVRPENVGVILARTCAREIHTSARRPAPPPADIVAFGFALRETFETDGKAVARLKAALEGMAVAGLPNR